MTLVSVRTSDPVHAHRKDEVQLSSELWQLILEQLSPEPPALANGHGHSSTTSRLAVCIARIQPGSSSWRGGNAGNALRTLVCWAGREEGSSAAKEGTYIAAHRTLRTRCPHLIGPSLSSVTVWPTSPVCLSKLFLAATDERSYEWAADHEEELVDNLCRDQAILRHGESLAIPWSAPSESNGYLVDGQDPRAPRHVQFRIVMTEPVLQGYATEESTEIIVTAAAEDNSKQPSGQRDAISPPTYEIDEDFLAASLLDGAEGSGLSSVLTEIAVRPFPGEQNGHVNGISQKEADSLERRTIKAVPLTVFPSPEELQPCPLLEEDEHLRIFVKTADLGRHGLFSGDLAVIDSDKDSRLVRVFGHDEAAGDATFPAVALSPLLLFNMSTPSVVHLKKYDNRAMDQSASLYPTAQAVSVARIASEYSMHRRYQAACLSGLKHFFQSKRRIMKQGDLIAIPIDESSSRFDAQEEDEIPQAETSEHDEDDLELPLSGSQATAVAYFKITSLDGTILSDAEDGSLGFYVDPAVTTMVQTGLENSLVPDLTVSPDIHSLDPPLPSLELNMNELGKPTILSRLTDLANAALRPGSSSLDLSLTILLKGARGSGKSTIARWAARKAGFHLFELDCYDLLGETDIKTEGNLAARYERAAQCSPCILLLKHLEALARKSQTVETGQEPTITVTLQDCLKTVKDAWATSGLPVIVMATAADPDKIPTSLLGLFKEELSVEAPNEAERLLILQNVTRDDFLSPDVSLRLLAVQTAALVAGDLVDLASRARLLAAKRTSQITGAQVQDAGVALTAADFVKALDQTRSSYSESIGAPKIPNVTWDDVGGLATVKTEILDTIQLPLEHPELFADGLKKRSGVLLYGPPGTGKTLLAKAVATSCSLNFFSVKGPELLNMYIGESEANVRRVFQRARDAKPCVIFFDELDSVAPKRGNQGDSGGVMDRIVSQLLAELDGMAEGKGGADVFVIGATNRPDLLDPALLRPGRFDRMLYLGVSDTHDAQLKIIEALTRKFKLDPHIDLRAVAEGCPFNYTGADFYALCSDAMLKAMTRTAESVDRRIATLKQDPEYANVHLTPQYYLGELATPQEVEVLVSQSDFEKALDELVPSVSEAEMTHYRVVQQRFSGNAVGVADKSTKAIQKGKGKLNASA